MENLVYIELKRRNYDIFYWKNKNEVDFVIRQGRNITELIQVSYDIEDKKVRKREEAGLLEAMDTFGLTKGVIITDEHYQEIEFDDKKIIYIPLWAWLLVYSQENETTKLAF
jgi:predicted AAA+ superfamily ATPase